MAVASVARSAPPLTQSSLPAVAMASAGSWTSVLRSPSPSVAYAFHVDGRNCIGPIAPAVDRTASRPCWLSTSPTAATTVHGSPGQASAARLYMPRQDFGSAAALCPLGGLRAEINEADSVGKLTSTE